MVIITIGIGLAKNVFAVLGFNESGKHALARPTYPYRTSGKLGKNDAVDAPAICEDVTTPTYGLFR